MTPEIPTGPTPAKKLSRAANTLHFEYIPNSQKIHKHSP